MGISVFPAPASGPTLAEITSAGNSAGWGATGGTTWTTISTQAATSSSTLSFTSLSGYKYYKFVFDGLISSANRNTILTINGLTTGYYGGGVFVSNTGTNQIAPSVITGAAGINVFGSSNSLGAQGFVFIEQSNLTGAKNMSWQTASKDGSNFVYAYVGNGSVQGSTAAITSMAITFSGGMTGGNVTLYGGN